MSAAQPQVVAFLTRSGQAVEPNGDVAAVGWTAAMWVPPRSGLGQASRQLAPLRR
jgi:hypothetical protein